MRSTPWHFWPLVTLAFVWHLVGVIDYTAVQLEWRPWMAIFSQRQEVFIDFMPDWVDAAWAISAWVGLLGVLLMAATAGLAPLVLFVSAVATWVVAIWLGFFADPSMPQIGGTTGVVILVVSALFTLLLWLYARARRAEAVAAR